MSSNLTVLDFTKEEKEEPGVVSLQYTNGEVEKISADYMGMSEEMPGFLMLWNEEPYEMKGFRSISHIVKIDTERVNDNS